MRCSFRHQLFTSSPLRQLSISRSVHPVQQIAEQAQLKVKWPKGWCEPKNECVQNMRLRHRACVSRSAARSHHYVGFISKFDTMKGYGFVSCSETFKRFGRDIFIDRESYQARRCSSKPEPPWAFESRNSSKHAPRHVVDGTCCYATCL